MPLSGRSGRRLVGPGGPMRHFSTAMIGLSLLLILSACGPKAVEHVYPAWGFAVSFPNPPKETETPASPDGSQPHNFLAEDGVGGHDFAAAVSDISNTDKTTEQILDDVPPAVAASLGGTVGTTTYVSTALPSGPVTGHEVRVVKDGKTIMVMRVFVANGRLYQVGGSSLLGPDDATTKQFLDSFRLIGGAAPGAPATNAR